MLFARLGTLHCGLGESPLWDDRRGWLYCVDIAGHWLHALTLDGTLRRSWPMPGPAAALGLCVSGRVLVALGHRFYRLDPDSGALSDFAQLPAEEPAVTRLNDGKVGPDGAFWVGTMDDRPGEKAPVGALYRLAGDGSIRRIADGLIIANGVAFSADGRALYHADTRGRWIDRWQLDPATGAVAGRERLVADIDEATGRPDGAACDGAGLYWSCGVSAGVLNGWDGRGRLAARYEVPVPAPTMPCFCGPDLRQLVVTSHAQGRAAEHPLSGGLFLATMPTSGVAVARFADL